MPAGFDPAMSNQALATLGSSYRVPTLEEAQANAAQFAPVPQTGPEVSLLEQAASASAMPAPDVSPAFSMVPQAQEPVSLERPPEPAPRVIDIPEQNISATAPPVPAPAPAIGAGGGMGGPSGGGFMATMTRDATGRRKEAEAKAAEQELAGDVAAAGVEQATSDLGATRAATYAGVSDIQQRSADEGADYQRQLAEREDSYNKATEKAQEEQRAIAKFIGDYEPKDRRSMGQLAASAVAVALTSFSDAWTGRDTSTQVTDLIQRGIDRDLAEQQALIENKRTALAAKNTEIGQLREKFGDQIDTMKLARAMKLEQAAQEIEALKTQGMSAEEQAKADQAIYQLRLDRANALQGVAEQRFNHFLEREDRLKLARYQEQRAAAAARNKTMTPEQALKLQKMALENEEIRRRLAEGKPLTAEQLKRQSFLTGIDSSANTLARAVASGESAPGVIGRNAPDWSRGTEDVELDAAINAVKGILLRDESGASISEDDQAAKIAGWGIERGDTEQRKRGLRLMLEELNARRQSVGLPPINPVIRRGAAQ